MSAGELATTGTSGGFLAILTSGQGGGLGVSKPFAQPIRLIDEVNVAGTTHVAGVREIVEGLEPAARLRFERDPGNAHDPRAIRVFAPDGSRIGWVPADVNDIPARLMDAGKELYGAFVRVEQVGSWTRIVMDVYLDD